MSQAPNSHRPWQEIAHEAQARRAASIAEANPPPLAPGDLPRNVMHLPARLLNPHDLEITNSTIPTLLANLSSGTWTAVAVTTAFLRRAALAQALTNCITDLLPMRALSRAAELDAHLKRTGLPIGPLHGLPISVKEHIGMAGLDLNCAYCSLYESTPVKEDALVLQILGRAGAVFHARTAQPQTLMHLETSSNLYGVTVNPHNTALTAGGSSGGEGALIALGGSVLGLGTDIGGSVRCPAANCGIWGFKPTAGRMPMRGVGMEEEGREQILGTMGPMSASFEGLRLLVRTVLGARPWLKDPTCVALPWTEHGLFEGRQKLRIAVMWDDNVVRVHPPVRRALREVVEKLQKSSDVEIVEWTPYKHDESWEIISKLYFPDGGKDEEKDMASTGEPWRPLSNFIVKENPHVKPEGQSITEVWENTKRRDEYRKEYAQHWNKTATRVDGQNMPLDAVDLILCPVGPGAAPPLDCSRYWGYTSVWNLLNYPGLTFPVSKVDANLDVKEEAYQPRNEADEYNYQLYDAKIYMDAPVSLQLVGRAYEDEKVLQGFEWISKYL